MSQEKRKSNYNSKFWTRPRAILRSAQPSITSIFSSSSKTNKNNNNNINSEEEYTDTDYENNNLENSNIINNEEENNNNNINNNNTDAVFRRTSSPLETANKNNQSNSLLPPRPKKNPPPLENNTPNGTLSPPQKSLKNKEKSKTRPTLPSTSLSMSDNYSDIILSLNNAVKDQNSNNNIISNEKSKSKNRFYSLKYKTSKIISKNNNNNNINNKNKKNNNNNKLNDDINLDNVNIIVNVVIIKGILVNKNFTVNENNDQEEEIIFKCSQKKVTFSPQIEVIGGEKYPLETRLFVEKEVTDKMEINEGSFISGYLFKYLTSPFIDSKWLKRWVILNGRVLQYYSSEFSTEIIGKLELSFATSISIGRQFHIDGGRLRKFAIMVKFDDLNGYFSEHLFSHPNNDILKRWYSLFLPDTVPLTSPRRRMTIGEIARAPNQNPILENLRSSNSPTKLSSKSQVSGPSSYVVNRDKNYYHEENRKNSNTKKGLILNGEYQGEFDIFKDLTAQNTQEMERSSSAANFAKQRRRNTLSSSTPHVFASGLGVARKQ